MNYRVWCDEHLIFDTGLDSYKILNPKLELELNKTGSFDFTIYPNNPNFERLKKMKSIITVYQNDFLIFRGRILNDETGFYNEKQVSCEGELAFLVDSIQRPYEFKGSPKVLFTQLINNHNSQVDENKKFLVGNVTVEDANDYINRSDTQYLNTLDSIMKKLVEPLGGYLFVRHETDGIYLDWLKDFDVLSSQTIEFGKNLIDLNKVTKGEDIATAIIPLGAKVEGEDEKRLTISSVNNGVDYVYNEEAVAAYGWIFKTVIWEDVTVASNLLRKANEYLGEAKNLIGSIEISAIDIPAVGENPFRLGTYVSVVSKPHNLNGKLLVSKLSLHLLNPASNKLTLGATYSTFTEQSSGGFKTQGEIINNVVGTVEKTVDSAIVELEDKTMSAIKQSADEVVAEVKKDVYLKSETNQLVESVSSRLTQTEDEFKMEFKRLGTELSDVSNDSNVKFNEMYKYIRFIDGNIILGEAGNQITLKIENDRISFLQSGVEVAYFTNNKLYITDGEYTNSLKIGCFAFVPRTNGNLSVRKVE